MARDGKHRDGLDKDSLKRLEALNTAWGETPSSSGGFSLADLRLLLEHSSPLREVVHNIARNAQKTTQARPALKATPLPESKSTLDHYSSLEKMHLAVERDLAECNATVKKLQQENKDLLKVIKDQKGRFEQLEKQMQQPEKHLQAMLLLRSDPQLVRLLGLPKPPYEDAQALTQIVAILAQRESLERLWSALKDRCEADNRPANSTERALLETTLGWHNYNWRTHPYRLIEAVPSNAYQFELHLRSRKTSTGETVATLLLPGIQDGGGNPLCKALVLTR